MTTTETTTKAPTTTTATKPVVKEDGKKSDKKRPLIFDRPEEHTEPWIDKQLLMRLVFLVGKEDKDRRKTLLAAIKILDPNPEAQNWALEHSVVEAAVRKGDRKMAALQVVARNAWMPTLRVRSNGELIEQNERAVEILTAVIKSTRHGVADRWREMRALLMEAGFRASLFKEASELGRATDGKRHRAKLTAAVEGTDKMDNHRRKPRKEERGDKKK